MTNPVAIISSSGSLNGQPSALAELADGQARPERWAARGAWAILDQGLFALSNFATNVALARWLPPDDYGVFTIVYSVFLVIATVHTALLAEPMIVFGGGRYHARLTEYFGVLLRGHWLMTSVASLLLAVVAAALAVAGSRAFGLALLALSVAVPWVLLLWLMRRICYIRVGPHLAASGGVLYMTALMIGVSGLLAFGRLSPQSALILIGVGGVGAGLWIRSRLVLEPKPTSSEFRRSVLVGHWEYGRWAVGTGVFGAITLNIYYVVLPVRHGLESAAALKAMMNLVMPTLHSFLALSMVLLPTLVSLRGTPAFAGYVRRSLLLFSSVAIASWLVGGLLHTWLAGVFYGVAYADHSWLLWLVGLVPIGFAIGTVLESALRSLERSDEVFRASLLSALAAVLVGIPATLAWGPAFAAAGLVMGSAVSIFSMSRSLRGCLREWEQGSSAPGHPEVSRNRGRR